MNYRRFIISASAALALLAAPATAFAQSHLDKAIAETRKAIHYGTEAHHDSSFVQHVDNAIHHAKLAQKTHPNPHIKKAITYLRRGREIAYRTHWASILDRGAMQTTKALAQLKAAQ